MEEGLGQRQGQAMGDEITRNTKIVEVEGMIRGPRDGSARVVIAKERKALKNGRPTPNPQHLHAHRDAPSMPRHLFHYRSSSLPLSSYRTTKASRSWAHSPDRCMRCFSRDSSSRSTAMTPFPYPPPPPSLSTPTSLLARSEGCDCAPTYARKSRFVVL